MDMPKVLPGVLLLIFCYYTATGQTAGTAFIRGTVHDENSKPLPLVNVTYADGSKGTATDENGLFELAIPSDKIIQLTFSYLGYSPLKRNVKVRSGESLQISIQLSRAEVFTRVDIEGSRIRDEASTTSIPVQSIRQLPSASGGIEGLLKTMPGVSSSNELSSQYSVRGGNYDENLVYVNGFEIFRPFLVRSGQQEGLSFINPDLISNIRFSSGGFQPKYGDKMSSVLDIQYKKPRGFQGSAGMSMLDGSFHLEGDSRNHRLRYLLGLRQKSNQYVLDALDTRGEYRPSFTDAQVFAGYDLTTNLELELLGNYSRNLYRFIPEDRTTTTGVFNRVIRLTVFFDGEESDKFQSAMGGAALVYKPAKNLRLKLLGSSYYSLESEAFDIIGQYWLDEVETSFGKAGFGESAYNLGVGTFHDWARNNLWAAVNTIGHKGFLTSNNHYLEWGLNYQLETIDDRISEWNRLDSAGYSLPYSTSEALLKEVVKSDVSLQSTRSSAYFQDTWSLNDSNELTLTGGARISYWDLNGETLISPRAQLSFKPSRWQTDIVFRFASGFYHQPPFYRELRNLKGEINRAVKAQKSIHFVAGTDLEFSAMNRPFKFVAEAYYKYLTDLIPYEYDNVRIRYFGENLAKGYAAGIDFRLFGEFVEDAESWISISLLQTREDIEGDYYYDEDSVRTEAGYIPRPTDQRVNVGMYFQDYLPTNKNFKVHLNFLFGSGLPFGPPDHDRQKDTLRIPPYRRVDIGFSALLVDGTGEAPPRSVFRNFTSIWGSLEIFNLLGVPNTASYLWVKDITNTVYAMPNFLTSRRLNLKLIAAF